MTGIGHWSGGLAISLLAHAGIGAAVLIAVRPGTPPPQQMPEQRISVMAQEVRRSTAEAVAPESAPAAEAAATGTAAPQGAPPQSRAAPLAPPATPIAASTPTAPPLAPVAAPVARAALAPATAPTPPVTLSMPGLAALPPETAPLAGVAPEAEAAAALPPPGARLDTAAPAAPLAEGLPLPSERQVALLAPMAGGADPVLAETVAAFMRPGDIAASAAAIGSVRDGIGAALAQFPCARMQSGFNPDTGALELRGHIPDPAMRPAVLAALERQLGPGLPVADDLLILPRPQCQTLAGIEAVGLPQSTDQFTNPRVIGPDAHVRAYRFAAGARLELDMTAPDYDAVIYVDYFDAEGRVIHLQPNEIVPLETHAPAAAMTVGRERDGPSLAITIAPPFGQEIAVAFAASHPLYDGLRPMVEPAAPYLDFLAERVAATRASTPDFKGEWVYFMVVTGP